MNGLKMARYAAVAVVAALLGVTGPAYGADDAPAPAASESPIQFFNKKGDSAEASDLERELKEEMLRLKRLESELQNIETAPLPVAKPQSMLGGPVVLPQPKPEHKDLPISASPGSEEELANTLFALGEFKKAQIAYEGAVSKDLPEDRIAWAMFQIGNCARRTGDDLGAIKAYEALMNRIPEHPWAIEASWWASQLKWWAIWRQAQRNQGAQAASE